MASSPPTRYRILDAADELFGRVGFDAASTRRIAEQSGVNKALIHYHFATKEALFGAVIDRYYARLTEVVRDALAAGGDLEARLARLLDRYVDFLDENRSFSAMVQREVTGSRQLERIADHMAPLFAEASRLLERAFPAARGGALAAPELLLSFYGMAVSYVNYGAVFDQLLEGRGEPSALERRKAHLRRMLSLVVAELAADDAAAYRDEGRSATR